MDNVRTLDNNMEPAIIIRNTQQKDVSQIVALQKESFPDVVEG